MKLIEDRWVVWVLVVLAVASSFGVYWIHALSLQPQKNYGHYPDSIGYHLILNRYDDTGRLSTITTADQAMHYPDTKTTEFQTLFMQAFSQQGHPPVLIRAPRGIAYNKAEKVDVLGQVIMTQAADAEHPGSQVVTANLSIYPNQKYIETSAPLHAEQPGLQVDAVGARYNYDQEILNLLSKTQVIYQSK